MIRINLAARLHALAERPRDEWKLNLTIVRRPHPRLQLLDEGAERFVLVGQVILDLSDLHQRRRQAFAFEHPFQPVQLQGECRQRLQQPVVQIAREADALLVGGLLL